MTDRPIIFRAAMVRALLDGRKRMTRRIIKPQPELNPHGLWVWPPDWRTGIPRYGVGVQTDEEGLVQSLTYDPGRRLGYAPGDRLWVRETWTPETDYGIGYPQPFNDGRPIKWTDLPDWGRYWTQPHYRATDPTPDLAYEDSDEPACRWRSPIHMPRWASRLTLLVRDVRVQRLQEISASDAAAEGIRYDDGSYETTWFTPADRDRKRIADFAALWDSIHGPGAWGQNPWVAAVSFRTIRANIDEAPA